MLLNREEPPPYRCIPLNLFKEIYHSLAWASQNSLEGTEYF